MTGAGAAGARSYVESACRRREPSVKANPEASSDTEQDVHHVSVLDKVLLPLAAQTAVLLRLRETARRQQLIPADHLRPDEPALDVRVDATGRLQDGGPGGRRPGAALRIAAGEEGDEPQHLLGQGEDARRFRLGGAHLAPELGGRLWLPLRQLRPPPRAHRPPRSAAGAAP